MRCIAEVSNNFEGTFGFARPAATAWLRSCIITCGHLLTPTLTSPEGALRPQAISNSLWSYSKLGYNPGHRVLDLAARRAAAMLHQYTSQEIANTLWAFATLEQNPGAGMLDAAALQILRRIEQFSPQVRCIHLNLGSCAHRQVDGVNVDARGPLPAVFENCNECRATECSVYCAVRLQSLQVSPL